MANNAYWIERAERLENSVQQDARLKITKVQKIYRQANQNIKNEIKRTFANFQNVTGTTGDVAKELISKAEQDKSYAELLKLLNETTDDAVKQDIENRINAQAYGYRMTRAERMQQKVYTEYMQAGAKTEKELREHLEDTYRKSYYTNIVDYVKGTNIGVDFTVLNKNAVKAAIERPWLGANFSDRLWTNTNKLAATVQEIVASGITSGQSVSQMAERIYNIPKILNKLDDKERQGIFEATRLIRTETNNCFNQGNLQAYKEEQCRTYRYCATLDNRTSQICAELDGEEFPVDEARPGVNYPPMHPNCRSTTIRARNVPSTRLAKDKDGNYYHVDGKTTFRDWYRSLTPEQQKALKFVDNGGRSGIIKIGNGKIQNINRIEHPIEKRHTGKGNPNAIIHVGRPLNNRQKIILEKLTTYDSSITVKKKSVNMKDLSALTAQTGDEFALFTRGNKRMIIRGNSNTVNVTIERAKELNRQGYKWSGHTHPGIQADFATPSDGDKSILSCFDQSMSVIYNSMGKYRTFEKE